MLHLPPIEGDRNTTQSVFPTKGRDEDESLCGAQARESVERSTATTWALHDCVVWRQQLPEQP